MTMRSGTPHFRINVPIPAGLRSDQGKVELRPSERCALSHGHRCGLDIRGTHGGECQEAAACDPTQRHRAHPHTYFGRAFYTSQPKREMELDPKLNDTGKLFAMAFFDRSRKPPAANMSLLAIVGAP